MINKARQIITGLTSNQKWAILIGTGLALFPIHNVWLTEVMSIGDMPTFFLPAMGAILWLMGTLLFIQNNWHNLNLGSKQVYIPLLIIIISMGVSGFLNNESLKEKVAPLFMGLALFASYIVARRLGTDIFRMLVPFVCLGIVIAVVIGILNPGVPSGGLITNYCASAGFLIFGAIVNQGKWQWALLFATLIGVFFIGALEGAFIVGVVGIVVLARRDFNKYLLISLGALFIIAIIWALRGNLLPLYKGNNNLIALYDVIIGKAPLTMKMLNAMTSQRWEVYVEAIKRFNFIGYGYSLDLSQGRNIHNVPLMIMHQIGILAAISWLWLSVYCAVKTKWHYAWLALLAMCVFDHYIWTQFGAFWWCLVGVSTASSVKSDLVFRKEV